MKRIGLVALVVVMAFGTASIALAYNQTPAADTYTDGTNYYADNTLWIQSSGGGGSCSPQVTGLVRWNLQAISNAANVGTVTIRVKVSSITIGSTPVSLSLYSVADDTWPISGAGTLPAIGATELAHVTVDPAVVPPGTILTFVSTTPTGLADYVGSQLVDTDDIASFAIRVTGCSSGAPRVNLYSSRSSGNEPTMEVAGPNAVDVSSAKAEPASWPLYAGLGAVALFVVAGVVISRRRTA